MQIEIHASGLTLTDLLRERLQMRLTAALRPFVQSVTRVSARLTDVNAARGGIDKRCRLVATVPGHKPVVVDAMHDDTFTSIDRAADRFRRALSRTFSRTLSRTLSRKPRKAKGAAMKTITPELLLSNTDMPRLREILTAPKKTAADVRPAMERLQRDLDRGEVRAAPEVPAGVVTMRSCVRIEDLHTGDRETFTLVYPDEADLFEGKLSVLAPLGAALLGAKAGDTLDVQVKTGIRQIKVDRLLYQPEAAGDFDR